ncbi:MAG: GntR family transcriptional regulator [Alteromonadaceae bacterium]|nr:GntR family transcriptional regulator [Alteromonadaceae bacterium]|tara:strand:- start:1200 stop:2675 length:1476 start_codon:yes stop_codon:yes gene_type:complete
MTILYSQIADQLQQAFSQGAYQPGDRLPGVRILSRQFGVSISTILQAHQLLEARGYLEARERSGYFVRHPHAQSPVPLVQQDRPRPAPVTAQEMALELLSAAQDKRLVHLGAAVPHADFLPFRQIQQATAWAARQGAQTLDYAFPGNLALRRQLAQRMTGNGCPTGPDELVVTTGCQEALILALRAVTRAGDIVALESPAFPGILSALELLELRAIEIPTDPVTGLSLEGLQLALEQWPIAACIAVPNHNNPLGCRMSDARKQQLVGMLAAANVPLVEDDIYGDLTFGDRRPRPAKAFDTTGHVLYCSSFSKTISPGLRVGWINPGRYREAVLQQKYFTNIASATIPQMAVAHFLEQGGYDRYLRSVRLRYQDSMERLRSAIARWFPDGTAVSRPVGGVVLWVELPPDCSGTTVYHRARAAGISVYPGKMFSTSDRFEHCLRLNAANPWNPTLEKALQTLGEICCGIARESEPSAHDEDVKQALPEASTLG